MRGKGKRRQFEEKRYEKIKIYPCIYTTGATNANHIKEINAIQFSLHFYLNDNWTSGSTKYHEIGFSSDDIIYRRKKLQRSFIRLSYFDSKDFKTQNLLYYSTIFIDCDKLYSEYIKNGNTLKITQEDLLKKALLNNVDPSLTNQEIIDNYMNDFLKNEEITKDKVELGDTIIVNGELKKLNKKRIIIL